MARSPAPSNNERPSRNVRRRINEPNVEAENEKDTWIAIAAFDKEKKEVKVKWLNNTVSEFMDPIKSFDTAGAFQRLVEHLEKAANEVDDANDDEELEAWIVDLTRLQKECEKREAADHVRDEEIAFCCSTCRCTEDERMNVSEGQVGVKTSIKIFSANTAFTQDMISAGDNRLYHRMCCHKIQGAVNRKWRSPLDKVQRKFEKLLLKTNNGAETGTPLMGSTVEKKYRKAWEEEHKFHCNYQEEEKIESWVSRNQAEERNFRSIVSK